MLSSADKILSLEEKKIEIDKLLNAEASTFFRSYEYTDGSSVLCTRNTDLSRQIAINKIIIDSSGEQIVDDEWSRNLFNLAIRKGYSEIVRSLIEKKIDVNSCDSSNKTFLHLALEGKNHVIIRYLIKAGADVNARSKEGKTPLYYALESKYEDIVKILIEAGADVNARSKEGKTPLYYAIENYDVNFFKILIGAGADVSEKSTEGENLIHILTKKTINESNSLNLISSMIIIEYLIGAGLDINEKTDKGETAYSIALKSRRDNYMAENIKELPQFISQIKQKDEVCVGESKRKLAKDEDLELINGLKLSEQPQPSASDRGLPADRVESVVAETRVSISLLRLSEEPLPSSPPASLGAKKSPDQVGSVVEGSKDESWVLIDDLCLSDSPPASLGARRSPDRVESVVEGSRNAETKKQRI